jgi:hypothetical protein
MNTRMLARLLLIVFLILTVGSASAQSPEPANPSGTLPAGTKFTFYDVDSGMSHDYGRYLSLALDPRTGTPYVSYYDAVGQKLRLAHMVNSGGNCGYDGHRLAWFCETVSLPTVWAGDDVGQHVSMAIYSTGGSSPQWKLGLAYFNASLTTSPPPNTSKGLFYTVYACPATGPCTWTTSLVDGAQVYYAMGRLISLKFDSAGNPRIAYASGENSVNNEIRYARYLGTPTGSGCSRHDWQCDVAVQVYQEHAITQNLSLDLDGLERPHIAYTLWTLLGDIDLRYARLTGSGNCGPNNTWQCDTIDAGGGGPDVSLIVSKGPIPIPRIAYYGYLSDILYIRLATPKLGGGGYCGPGNTWVCQMIDAAYTDSGYLGISLVEDSKGYPVIAYRDPDARGGGRLKWAQPSARLGQSTGNCGPMSAPNVYTWQCDLVAGTYGAVFGQRASLALNSAGLAYIASYDDTPPGFLEISYQQIQLHLPRIQK